MFVAPCACGITFSRGGEGSVSDKDFVKKMWSQVVMIVVAQMWVRVCFGGNVDEISLLHSLRDNNAWMVVLLLLPCVIHKTCVCTITILYSYF